MIKDLENFDLVIFGGDGDLSLRKIIPALINRIKDGQIKSQSKVIVASRSNYTTKSFIAYMNDKMFEYGIKIDQSAFNKLIKMISYVQLDLTISSNYQSLYKVLETSSNPQTIFYYSTPSKLFDVISKHLFENKLINDVTKIVLEKPLGSNLKSFERLNKQVRKYFREDQIYRIDHYLGKETVQNLMVLRFANHLYELAWNAQNIDNVQITVAESIGVESRKEFYDSYGALKDMIQNHLLQLLCLVAMEPPSSLTADNVRNEKLKVLQSLRSYKANEISSLTVKGQYTRGEVDSKFVNSYQEDIETYESNTETFVALRTYIDNWRWAGVPFYLRTGKRMPARYSEIVINFKRVAHNLFPSRNKIDRNKLIIRLQPEERIELVQMVKLPGPGGYRYKPISLELDYGGSFSKKFPEAYERLLIDVVRGNQTLFMHEDEVRASWEWIHSITDNWDKTEQELELYKAGSDGPGNKVLKPSHYWHQSKAFGNEEVAV